MYHRFEENKYPSTNVRIDAFKKHIDIIKDSQLEFLDPKNFIEKISRFQINNILLESGPNLLGSFGDVNLIDEFIFYISPEKLGSQAEYFYKGKNKINFFDNKQFDIVEETQVGKDKKIVFRKK